MKKIQVLLATATTIALLAVGCKKVEPLPYYDNGSQITVTASKAAVAPTPADSLNKVLTLAWTSPNYSSDPGTYKFIVEIDSAGRNFSRSIKREVTGKQEYALTGKDLNAIALSYGFKLGSPTTLDIRVTSSYGNNNEQYASNPVKVAITPYTDPSVFSSTATTVTGSLATAAQTALTFSWTPSFNGYNGTVTYTLQFDSADKAFSSPHEITIGASLYKRDFSQGEINATALDEGVPGGSQGKVEYRVKATTAQGAEAYSNAVAVTLNTYQPLVRLYMPGSYQVSAGYGTEDWKPETAPEFIRDQRPEALNKLYYMYIYLPASTEFKITPARDWSTAYGDAGGGSISTSGGNISVSAAGYYRISVDLANMKYDIREGRMGFVGGGTGAGWTPPNVFPNYAMGLAGTNLFVGLTSFTVDDWKMIDNNDWNNGDISAANARSYGSNGPSGSALEVNGPNMPKPATAGRYRVIWDGRNPDALKYEMYPATEMRLVGDGIDQAGVGDWSPATSPQMTYQGAGIWKITIALKANKNFKFLAGNDWGAFDYEDQSGSAEVGKARAISWNSGGSDFKTPTAAGTYTITLDENKQTVTIN